jgi:hypothetical protein
VNQVVILCCYKRYELLFCCLKRVREAEPLIPIFLFPDRGTWKDARLQEIAKRFDAQVIRVPEHSLHGNSYNAGEALRYAYNAGIELVHYLEEDALPKPDLFPWTLAQHEDFENIFCSAGWVFNLHSPIDSGDYFAPWIYIPQFSIKRDKLEMVVEHLGPSYYNDMQKYLSEHFKDCGLNAMYPNVVHYEIDGLLQRVITVSKLQVVWPSVAKVEHAGYGGYNRGGYEAYDELFKDIPDFNVRVELVESLMLDEYWRASVFGREIVEREVGHAIAKREFLYRIKFGEWESTFKSELTKAFLPKRINSVRIPPDAELVIMS